MVRHRPHSTDLKRQAAQNYMSGETFHRLARQHDLSRNLIRTLVQKHEAGASTTRLSQPMRIEAYEAWIAALERLIGKQALEIELLKRALPFNDCTHCARNPHVAL